MNIHLSNFCNFKTPHFKEQISIFLTPRQKLVSLVAIGILATLALSYVVYQHFFTAKKLDSTAEKKDNNEKIESPKQTNGDSESVESPILVKSLTSNEGLHITPTGHTNSISSPSPVANLTQDSKALDVSETPPDESQPLSKTSIQDAPKQEEHSDSDEIESSQKESVIESDNKELPQQETEDKDQVESPKQTKDPHPPLPPALSPLDVKKSQETIDVTPKPVSSDLTEISLQPPIASAPRAIS